MADNLEWLLPAKQLSETRKNKQLTANLTKIVELARPLDGDSSTVSSKQKVGFRFFQL
jgi:hypothetical protein